MLTMNCPMCGRGVRFEERHRNRKTVCKSCGETFALDESSVPPPPPRAEQWDAEQPPDRETDVPVIVGRDAVIERKASQKESPAFRIFTAVVRAIGRWFSEARYAITVVMGLIFAFATYDSPEGVFWLVGGFAMVCAVTAFASMFAEKFPRRERWILSGGVVAGLIVAFWIHTTATYRITKKTGELYKTDIYRRTADYPFERSLWGDLNGHHFDASGPLSESGKRHGKWTIEIDGRSEFVWYFFGERVSEAEWHRSNRD